MDLYAVIDQVASLLQRHGRVSYRSIQLQFDLSAEQLAVVCEELTAVRELAVDKEGKMLVWSGDRGAGSAPSEARESPSPATTQAPPPATYTPPHLAERIRTEQ